MTRLEHVLHTQLHFDARETAILSQQLEEIEAQSYDIEYAALNARRFIPTNASNSNAAETISYGQRDQTGRAKVIANYGDDAPRVDVSKKKFTMPVVSIAAAYGYSIQDLRAAAQSGEPLDATRAAAARRAIEAEIDNFAAFGAADAGLGSFLKVSDVPLVTPITGTWASADPAEILADIAKLLQNIVTATKTVHKPNTLLLDTASYGIISQRPYSDTNPTTILQAFLAGNPYISVVDQWTLLDTANASNNGPRLVAYDRNPAVCEMRIPQDFETLPAQEKNFEFVVNCHARFGGVVTRYPLAMAYMDGV